MINQLFKSLFINTVNNLLTKEQKAVILHDIEIINYKRMKLLLAIYIIIELLFIKFVDIPNLRSNSINITWTDKRYFILHLLILIVASAGIIVMKIFIKNNTDKSKKINRIVVPVLIMVILVLISIINGLDQIKIGNSSSVFISNMIICSAVILIRFPIDLLVYSVPFSTFIWGLLTFQKDHALLHSNILNGSIFFVAAIIISKIVYDSHINQMYKNIMLEEVNLKLIHISNHDPLTGLSNRRNFEIETKQKMEILMQHGQEASLILLDIDHFKNVNDKFGHPIGDIVLKEISNILLENIKATDLASRWGGEEFLIFLPQTSIDEAYALANKIRVAIESKVIKADNFKINITASFGVTQLKDNFSNSFYASYKLVDNALYKAKSQGRNQVVVASFSK